jgi:hypothetical protein
MESRHKLRPGESDDDIDEEQFLQFRRQESSQLSRQSSLRSRSSLRSLLLLDSQKSQESQKSDKANGGFYQSLESQESHGSAIGIPREFDYLFRSSQNDEDVIGLNVNSPISLSIGVVCVAQRTASDNNVEIKAHTLQKTFYSYPKNAEEKTKKTIEDRIENDVADFKLQGYNVTTFTFGLPFVVEEISNISRGYDGKTKMLRAARRKRAQTDNEVEKVHKEHGVDEVGGASNSHDNVVGVEKVTNKGGSSTRSKRTRK